MARRAPRAAAAAWAAAAFAAAPPAAAGGCAAQTLDCGNAPARVCAAFVEALSGAGGARLADTPGAGPHMRVEITHIDDIGLTGRLVRRAPGGAERVTPVIQTVVLDHPGGLPDSVLRDFAEALLGAETGAVR